MTTGAKVIWLPSSEGGRVSLPDSNRYVTIAKFPHDGPDWPNGAWSVVLDFETPPSQQGSPSLGKASFLMETAPHERLQAGERFELYEGLRKVANIEL